MASSDLEPTRTIEDHAERAHSEFGMSAMAQYTACPGSVRLKRALRERGALGDGGSTFTREGTAAHELAQWALTTGKEPDAYSADTIRVEGDEFPVHAPDAAGVSMVDYVRQYTNAVRERMTPASELFVEQRFRLDHIAGGVFGTADAVIYDRERKRLTVLDLKYGAGKLVKAVNNLQLCGYGLGAYDELRRRGGVIADLVLVIVQPRRADREGTVRTWTLKPHELFDFSGQLREAITRAQDPDAPLVSGPHCRDTFCPAQAYCPRLRNDALDMLGAEIEAGEVKALRADYASVDVPAVLRAKKMIEAWLSAVEAVALQAAKAGNPPAGFQLKRHEATVWASNEAAAAFIAAHNLPLEDATKPVSFKTPLQVKALRKAKEIDEKFLTDWKNATTTKQGQPHLVPASEPGEAVPSAIDYLG